MAWLPGIDDTLKPALTTVELWFVIIWDYMQILLFAIIFLFVLANIWQILIVQGRWKTAPLLIFYVLALVIATQRIIIAVLQFDNIESGWFIFICIHSPTTKLAIGFIQIWMVTELALKMRVGIQLTRDPEAQVTLSNRVLMRVQIIAMVIICTIYVAFSAFGVYLCTVAPNETTIYEYSDGLAIGFLVAFVLLGVVNLYLAVQLRTMG